MENNNNNNINNNKWIVCKFGGTSVSSKKTWDVIVERARKLNSEGYKVCIVVSAVSQMTNNLEKVLRGLENTVSINPQTAKLMRNLSHGNELNKLKAVLQQQQEKVVEKDMTENAMKWIVERHQKHCEELGIDYDEIVAPFVEELSRLVEGIRLTGDSASSRLQAKVFSFGELISSHVGEQYLKKNLQNSRVGIVDARQVFIANGGPAKSDNNLAVQSDSDCFLNADVTPSSIEFEDDYNITEALDLNNNTNNNNNNNSAISSVSSSPADPRASYFVDQDVVITQGFIASTRLGQTCVLGRGGSDTSGALFAALLSAERYEIWTDVDGMFSSDPRFVPNAHLIEELSYREAQELAAMGAKVLHPRCLGPASWGNIPVEIHNTMCDNEHRTTILSPEHIKDASTGCVMAIVRRTGQVLLTLSTVDMWGESGFLSRAFAPFQHLGISVDLIATSQYAVSMTLDYIPEGVNGQPFSTLVGALEKHGRVTVQTNCAVVSIVGRKLRTLLHGMADAFKELERYDVLLLSESTEDLNMSFVLGDSSRADDLVQSLHQVLLEKNKTNIDNNDRPGRTLEREEMVGGTTNKKPSKSPTKRLNKHRTGSFGIFNDPSIYNVAVLSAAQSSMRNQPSEWWESETLKYKDLGDPYFITDLSGLRSQARTALTCFPLSWSEQPAILRALFEENKNIIFLCRTTKQVLHLYSILGPGVKVHIFSKSINIQNLPDLNIINNPPSDEEIIQNTLKISEYRILVTNVLCGDSAVVVDAWFKPRPHDKIVILNNNHIPKTTEKVLAMPFDQDILDTLFETSFIGGAGDDDDDDDDTAEHTTEYPKQIILQGVTSQVFNTFTQAPVEQFIRF